MVGVGAAVVRGVALVAALVVLGADDGLLTGTTPRRCEGYHRYSSADNESTTFEREPVASLGPILLAHHGRGRVGRFG
jgi:hypothetical protein